MDVDTTGEPPGIIGWEKRMSDDSFTAEYAASLYKPMLTQTDVIDAIRRSAHSRTCVELDADRVSGGLKMWLSEQGFVVEIESDRVVVDWSGNVDEQGR